MAVTIADVARAAGVSKGSVSFALNGRPGLSRETRARILTVAEELRWTPSLRARSLSSSRAYAVGIVFPRAPQLLGSDPFFPSFIAGVETLLSERDYGLVLHFAPLAEVGARAYRKLVQTGRVDGVILTDMRNDDSRIELLQELDLPAVTLNRPVTPSPFPAIRMDDTRAITTAVEHLIGLGHTRIAHVGGIQQLIHGRSRRVAWEAALVRAGLTPDLFVETDFSAAAGVSATRELLSWPDDPPTAIVYANDIMAIASQAFMQEEGVRIPDDVSITGFDDTEIARYSYPALTSIATDTLHWGRVCAEVLVGRIEGTHDGRDTVLAAPKLVIRQSTGPAPKPAENRERKR